MHELFMQLITYAQGMWRYRWYALLVAWILAMAGWGWVYSLPNKYRADARVYVDTESILRPLLSGLAIESDVRSRVSIMTQTLLSRPTLETVARKTDLDLRAQTPAQFESLLTRLQEVIEIQTDRRQVDLYTISYTDTSPQMAQRVVQTLLDTLVEQTLGSSRSDTASAQRFLDDQIRQYEQKLTEAEQRLADFKRKNIGMMPNQGQGYYARLQAATDEIEKTHTELSVAENRRDELRKQLQAEEGNLAPSAPTDLETKIQERQKELDALLLRYTDQHPDVRVLRETIAQLKARREAEQSAAKTNRDRGSELNPVYQAVKIELSKAEVEVASLRAQLADRQRKVNELRKMVDTIPEVEAELVRLNRDYDVNKAQYDTLVKRKESARLSQQAEQKSSDIKLRVVEPPVLPRKPAGPKRLLYLNAVLLGSLAAGIGLAFLLSEMRPVFLNTRTLRDVMGLPVLGSVSLKLMPKQRMKLRIEIVSFMLVVLLLLAAHGGALMLQEKGVRVAQALLRMV
jgi:protein tyrosine kinase modulator